MTGAALDEHHRVAAALRQVTARLENGGEERAGQREMAEAVARAVAEHRHLVVQAGTGTGKSLGYLVPAALSGAKVVVATATKALQDQLAERDLPLVEEGLEGSFTWAVLKGRNNYLCRQRGAELAERGFQAELEALGDADSGGAARPGPGLADQVRRLLGWAEGSASGDRAELEFEPIPRAWQMVSVGPRECPGAYRCPAGPRCFAEAARDAAAAADIVVVNLHLYGAHLASGGAVLPPHDVVIFDEVHQLEDVMTATLGVELSPGRLRALANLARPLETAGRKAPSARVDDLLETADALSELLAERVGTRAEGGGDLGGVLARADEVVRATMEALRGRGGEAPGGDDDSRRQRALSAATHLVDDLQRLEEARPGDVRWVDGTRRAPVLRASPIDVGGVLGSHFDEVTAVMTSATVPPRLRERLGMDPAQSDEIDVGSPFDYPSRALLYVARHLPDRRHEASEAALHGELETLVGVAGGRTLGLFTSHRALDAATAALRDRLGVRLWRQGDLPKGRLLAAFTEEETSCLFATLGFWQGIDVPGPSLSLVTLDRIPFPRPDDPVLEARREAAGGGAFSLIDLPRAATMLAQGAGRLIRSATDTGVVAVLDPRLATAGYRRVLLARVPPMRRSTDPRQVADFLRAALAG